MSINKPVCPIADTFENLNKSNVIFKDGQRIYDTTNKKWKTGDGNKTWSELEYDTSASGDGSDGSGDLNGVLQEELERLNYYGDKDIIPSDENLFIFSPNDDKTASISLKEDIDKDSITELVIPYKYIDDEKEYKITSIGDYAFFGCENLTSITIPNSVTSIGSHAFYKCHNLTRITIPNSVTSIGSHAFDNCNSLTSITIPNSVTSIDYGAFFGCESLTSIDIPDNVTSIFTNVFFGCRSLKSIDIPDSITSIGDSAFSDCSSLTSIDIPDSVTSIDICAFDNCNSLTRITIPNSVTSIGDCAFRNCSEDFIIICNSGSYAETYAKENGIKYAYNYVKAEDEDSNGVLQEELERLIYYGDKDIFPTESEYIMGSDGALFVEEEIDVDTFVAPYKLSDGSLVRYTINLNIRANKIIIPSSVTRFGEYSFRNIKEVIIPKSVKDIEAFAFADSIITEIIIPKNVEKIYETAFKNTTELKYVYFENDNVEFYTFDASREDSDYVFYLDEWYSDDEPPRAIVNPNLTFICNPGSTAETYAKKYGIKYEYNHVKSEDLGGSSNGIIKLDPVTVDVYIDLSDPENLPHSEEFLLESLNIKSMDLNQGFYLLPVNYTMIGQQYYGEVFISVNKQSVILYDDEPYESITYDYVYMFKNKLYAEAEHSHIYPIATKVVNNLDYDDNGSIYALSQRQGYELNKQLEGLPNIIADFEAIANNVVTFDDVQDDLTNPDLDDELGHRLPPSVNAMKQYVAENSSGGSLLDTIHLENQITGYGDLYNVNKEVLESINFSSLNLTEGDYKLPVIFNPIWGGTSSVELLVHISKEEHTAETWDNNDNPILKTTNSYYYNVQIKGETYTSSNGSEFYPMSTRIIDNLEISDREIIYALSQNQGIILNNKINELSDSVNEIPNSYLDVYRLQNDIYNSDLADSEELCMHAIPSVKFLKDYISNMFYLDGDNLKISIGGKTFTLTPDAE